MGVIYLFRKLSGLFLGNICLNYNTDSKKGWDAACHISTNTMQ